MHKAIMVMGVSGCGKSTIGAGLADALGGVFLDGDDYHPQSNVDQMAAGIPLTDEMRWPWLDALARAVRAQRKDLITVFACSALRKTYRDHLREAVPDLKVVFLEASHSVIAARLAERTDHYMPATLLDSQFDTLEVPAHADAIVSVDQPVADVIAALRRVV